MTGDRQEGQFFLGDYASPWPPGRGTLVRGGEAARLIRTALAEEPPTDHGGHGGTA
ncbi:hypothetical protein ABZ719_29400 [Streptomyces sp. NPDC006743]|uniref:hypothetical protein n=1 Tax=Streptomyces sp. NPDC006743 TaxID=3154480 RepID=UPI0034535C4D